MLFQLPRHKINRKGQKYAKYLSKVRSIAATYTGKRKVSLNKENTTITIGFIEALGQKRQTKGATVRNKQKKAVASLPDATANNLLYVEVNLTRRSLHRHHLRLCPYQW